VKEVEMEEEGTSPDVGPDYNLVERGVMFTIPSSAEISTGDDISNGREEENG
jgi:hypothetical protein